MAISHRLFTMLELVIVMLLLVIAFAIVTPRLSGFFGGRELDDSAKRLWALSRYGRQEAILRGVPMGIWWKSETRELELAASPGYPYAPAPRRYPLAADLVLDTDDLPEEEPVISWWSDGSISETSVKRLALYDQRRPLDTWVLTHEKARGLYLLSQGSTP